MQLRRAGDHLPHPRRAPPFVHATERRRVQASDARPDEQQQRCVRFATLLLPEELRQRALDTPRYVTSRRCWIAGSRRADSNSGHNDGNRGRLGLSRRESLVSMRAPARPLGTRRRFSGGLGPHQAHFDRRFQARVQAPENKNSAIMRDCAMARPGLEPGTPRFSVVRSESSNQPKSPANNGLRGLSPRCRHARKFPSFRPDSGDGWRLASHCSRRSGDHLGRRRGRTHGRHRALHLR
jgi:hypothetical protein